MWASFFALAVMARVVVSGSRDVSMCKLSHSGIDYLGPISRSFSGPRCLFWDSGELPYSSAAISDDDFPDGSKRSAGSQCRNPTGRQLGPWCYTVDPTILLDICEVPLCSFESCRLSGTGMEYAGNISKSGAGENCLDWSGISKYKKENPKVETFKSKSFPESSVKWAGHKCRNPDGDVGGPWCYIKKASEVAELVSKAYCDVSMCEDVKCTVLTTREMRTHSEYTSVKGNLTQLKFSVRLWDPRDWKNASLKLAVSLIAVPGSGKQQLEWKTGFEVVISNLGSYFTGHDDEKEKFPGILTGSSWTNLRLSWGDEYISLLKEGEVKALLVEEHPAKKNTLRGVERVTINYYAAAGRNILWSFQKCEDECPEHISSRSTFSRLWPMRQGPTGYGVQVFVRSVRPVCLQLRSTPTIKFPELQVCVDDGNNTYVSYRQHSQASELRLKQVISGGLLSWWSWQELSISLSAGVLSLWTRGLNGPGLPVFDVEIPGDVQGVQWFGLFPLGGVAIFTLFCIPRTQPGPATPPECLRTGITGLSAVYHGSEWSSADGHPCLPWSAPSITLADSLREDSVYEDGSKESAINFCRNPGQLDPGGPFCYAIREDESIHREKCAIRRCRVSHCRIAGTANDYMGFLNKTRSGRNCQKWSDTSPHTISEMIRNASLFPDQSLEDAQNFCRNPSRNSVGTWCYTTSDDVAIDLCSVRDCAGVEECTVIHQGDSSRGGLYILPEWRMHGFHFSVKEWNPEREEGVVFEMRTIDKEDYYRLTIGADSNKQIRFDYVDIRGRTEPLKAKTVPHVVSAGLWASLWLKFPEGKILVGYKGLDRPILELSYKSGDFSPNLLSYHSIRGNAIGLGFECDQCPIEQTRSTQFTKLQPLNIWKPIEVGEDPINATDLRLYLQGRGVARLALIKLPGQETFYVLNIGVRRSQITLTREDQIEELAKADTKSPMFVTANWTVFDISVREKQLSVKREGIEILRWMSSVPFLVYYFSMGATEGAVIWAANCKPPDTTGRQRDGGWSPWSSWTCSVPCGGGTGRRERTCTHPEPNILGRACVGPARMDGPCNEWPCGDLAPQTLHTIRVALQRKAYQDRGQNSKRKKWTKRKINEVSELEWPLADLQHINEAGAKHEGIWGCFIYQNDLNLSWSTALISLKILPAPSFLSHLLEDQATKWLFGWTGSEHGAQALLIALFVSAVVICFMAYFTHLKLSTVSRTKYFTW